MSNMAREREVEERRARNLEKKRAAAAERGVSEEEVLADFAAERRRR